MASSTKDNKESGELPLQPSTVRNLSDKLYDKRKLGALEVEQLIKELNVAKDEEKIKGVIQYLVINFSDSSQGNSRKGGLIALAATAIGLGSEAHKYIPQLVPPVLKCFVDQDPRVRYYACESLYNIAKVARGKILIYFNEIFDALCKLSADPDINVKNGAQLLDRFVKDIVTESEKFDIEKFIPLLQERVYVINPYCRQFLIAWIVVLDSVPDIELLQYLPKFLDGLFNMLKDNTKDIRLEADACLAEFMREIKAMTASTSGNKRPVDFGSTVKILLTHSVSKDQFTRLTAIEWINEFIVIGREELLPFSAALLGSILPCLSSDVKNIRDASTKANNNLMSLITETTASFSINEILNTLISQLGNQNVPTRLASLSWILVLHSKVPDQLVSFIDDLFSVLLKTLSDSSDEVVRLDLEVMAKISMLNTTFFRKLMDMLVDLFAHNRELLNSRASLIVRQLSLFISSQKIYITLAEILEIEEDLEFASVMIQTLNFILLTTKELTELRSTLKNLSAESTPDSVMKPTELFTVLYRSWSHNPVATFSLCLLSQLYEHAAALIVKFGDLDISVNLLVEVDKLVQLLESPIFIYLRLQLLEPENYPFLYKCLYGLLMLLPQSNAYETLRNRLNSLSSLGILQLIPKNNRVQTHPAQINFDDLLAHFQQVQKKHREFKKQNIQK